MEKDKKSLPPLPYDMDDDEVLYHEMMSVASATECTGLIPSPPLSKPEVDSYAEIYDIPLAKDEMLDLEGDPSVVGDAAGDDPQGCAPSNNRVRPR